MINFRKVIEFLFKSFDISSDTKILQKMEEEGVRFLMFIKRHWIYSLFQIRRIFVVLCLAIVSIAIVFFQKNNYFLGIGISSASIAMYGIFVVVRYIFQYAKNYGGNPKMEDIHSCIQKSKRGDVFFTYFLNNIFFVCFSLIMTGIVSIVLGGMMFFQGKTVFLGIGIVMGILAFFNCGLFYGYLKKMMNLEMDFKIVVYGQVFFINQEGIIAGEYKNINSNKIKTIHSSYDGVIGSFFNYGFITILTEGDIHNVGEITMSYIANPNHTVEEMKKVLYHKFGDIEKKVNVFLMKIAGQLGMPHIKSYEDIQPHEKKRIQQYLHLHEKEIKKEFEEGTEETKNEIKELFWYVNT